MDESELIPESLVDALRRADAICTLTGAGASAESGIPTFRDALKGLWETFRPEDLATHEAFTRDPETVTRWYDERRLQCAGCRPNPGHFALARLQQWCRVMGKSFTLVTQNVDRLHQAAGSREVVELHGSLWEWRCTKTGEQREYRGGAFDQYPPRSEAGGLLRPAVVWFGEALPPDALAKASQAARDCDFFLSVGTSALVHPAAGLAHLAKAGGAFVAEVNLEPTPLSGLIDLSIRASAGDALPLLMDRLHPGWRSSASDAS